MRLDLKDGAPSFIKDAFAKLKNRMKKNIKKR
jgi:hypothetical protein